MFIILSSTEIGKRKYYWTFRVFFAGGRLAIRRSVPFELPSRKLGMVRNPLSIFRRMPARSLRAGISLICCVYWITLGRRKA